MESTTKKEEGGARHGGPPRSGTVQASSFGRIVNPDGYTRMLFAMQESCPANPCSGMPFLFFACCLAATGRARSLPTCVCNACISCDHWART